MLTILEPSSGGIGKRLNTAREKLSETHTSNAVLKYTFFSGTKTYNTVAMNASKMFDIGPARLTARTPSFLFL